MLVDKKLNREIIIKSKQGVCAICLSENNLELHHIFSSSNYNNKENHNSENNLLVLCKRCHELVHQIRYIGIETARLRINYYPNICKYCNKQYFSLYNKKKSSFCNKECFKRFIEENGGFGKFFNKLKNKEGLNGNL